MKPLRISLVAVLLVLCWGYWACLPWCGAADEPSSPEVKKTAGDVAPAQDDSLLLAYGDDPDTINPLTANDTVSEAFQRLVYEGFADRKYTDPDTFEPKLAERWEFDAKKLLFTIHLRKGVKFHSVKLPNGEELQPREMTSRDVKFTVDCLLNKNIDAAAMRSFFEDPNAKDAAHRYKIKLTVVDKYTVKIQWTQPYFLAEEITLSIPILPRHVFSVDSNGELISSDFSSKEFADGFNNHWANRVMCGTGPMRFKQWKRKDCLALDRNEGYWGKPYYFSKIVYSCIPNTNTMLQKILQNELDFAGISQKDQYLQSMTKPTVVAGKVKLVKYEYPAYRYIGYNMTRDFFKDKQVRWALARAVPVQQIIDNVFKGLARPISGPFMPGSSACDPSIKPIAFDLDAARKLLDEAGWKEGDDGVRQKTIHNQPVRASFELLIYNNSPAFATVAEIVKDNCRKIGVEVKISPVDWALMLQKLNKKDFDAAMLGWALSWKSDPYQIFHSSQADVPESSNNVSYRSAECDKLIETLRVTMDEAKQNELLRKIHRVIHEDQPYTFLFADDETAGYDSRLQNVKFYKIRPCIDSTKWHSSKARRD